MSILAALPVLVFSLACLAALAVLAISGRRAIVAWGELARAVKNCGEVRNAHVVIADTGVRPQLRLVEGGR